MFERLASRLLGHYIGQYITGNGLSPDHIHLQIARGDLTLEDVELNSDKIANDLAVYLDLIGSIQLLKSRAKMLDVKVPWSQLLGRGKPTVTLDSPEIVIRQSKGSEVDIEAHRKKALLASSTPTTHHGIAQNMAQYVGVRLMKRLEMVVKNLKLRIEVEGYERRGSQTIEEGGTLPPPACVFELEVGSISVSSDEASVFDSSERSVTIEDLIVTWKRSEGEEGRTILGPTDTKVFVSTSNKNQAFEIIFEALKATLNDSAYNDIMLMLDNFTTPPLKFKDIRPREPIKGSESARRWWGYAIEATRKMVREKNDTWKWENLKDKFEKRREFISLWLYALQTPLSKSDQERLEEIEKSLSVDDITAYRAIAQAAYEKQKTQGVPREKSGAGGGNLISKGISCLVPANPERRTLSFEELKELYMEIGYGELTKQDQLKIDLRFRRIGLDLDEDELNQEGKPKRIVETELLGVSMQYHEVDNHQLFSFGVDSLSSLDHFTNPKCPFQFIKAQLQPLALALKEESKEGEVKEETKKEGESGVETKEPAKEKEKEESKYGDAFQSRLAAINFEMNAPEVDYRVSVILEPIHFTVLQPTIGRLQRFILAPFLQPGLEDLQRELEDTYEQLKREAETQIKYAINQAKTLEVSTSIRAPTISFPESYACDENVPTLTLDLGQVIVKTDLQSREAAKSFNDGNTTVTDAYFFDKFLMLFSSINLHLETRNEEKVRLLDSFDLQVSADRSRVANSTLPLLKLKADAPPISLRMSPAHLASLMRILNSHLLEADKSNTPIHELKEHKPHVFVEPLESHPVEIKVRSQDQCLVTADLSLKGLSVSLLQDDQVTLEVALQDVVGALRQSHKRIVFNLSAGDLKVQNTLYPPPTIEGGSDEHSWISIPKSSGLGAAVDSPILSIRLISFLEELPPTTPKTQLDIEMDSLHLVFSDRFLTSLLDLKEIVTNWKSSIQDESVDEGQKRLISTKGERTEEDEGETLKLMKINFKMNQLHVSLHDRGRVIGRIELNQPHMAVLVNGEMALKCKFESFTLRNQMPGVLSSEWETALRLEGDDSMIGFTTLPLDEASSSDPPESGCLQLDIRRAHGVYLDQVANYLIEYFDGIANAISSHQKKSSKASDNKDSWTRLKIQIREGSVILPESATSSNHFCLSGTSWTLSNQREYTINRVLRDTTVLRVESINARSNNNGSQSELLRHPVSGSLTIDSFSSVQGKQPATEVSIFIPTPDVVMSESDFALLMSTILVGNLATKKQAKKFETQKSSTSIVDQASGRSLIEEFSSTLQNREETTEVLPGSSRPTIAAPPTDTNVSLQFSMFDLTLVGSSSPSLYTIKQEQFARVHAEGAMFRWEMNGTSTSTVFTTRINQVALFDELNPKDEEGLLFITPEEDSDEDALRIRCYTKKRIPEEGTTTDSGGVSKSDYYEIETGDVNLQFYPDLLDRFPSYVKSLLQTVEKYTQKEEASEAPEVISSEEEEEKIGFTANKLRVFALKESGSSNGFAFSCVPRIDSTITRGKLQQLAFAAIECGIYRFNHRQHFGTTVTPSEGDGSLFSYSSFVSSTASPFSSSLIDVPSANPFVSTSKVTRSGRSLLRGARLGVIPHEGIIDPFEIGFQYASERSEKYVLVLSALSCTVSYRDLALMKLMASSWGEGFNKFTSSESELVVDAEGKERSLGFFDKLLNRTPSDKQEALSVRCRDIELWITDDSNTVTELPLLAFSLRGSEFNLYNWSSIVNGDLTLEPSAMYFNNRVEAWEPLLDHVILKCLITSKMNGAFCMNVNVNGGKVELTLSEASLALAARLEDLWRQAKDIEVSPPSQRSLYYIKNLTGHSLEFWIPQLNDIQKTTVDKDQVVAVSHLDNKLGVGSNRTSRRLPRKEDYTLSIQVGSSNPIEDIPLLGHGKHVYELISKKGINHLICEVMNEDNTRIMVLRSHVEIVNQCTEPIRVEFESKPSASIAGARWPKMEVVTLTPGSSYPVPLRFIKEGSFRVGPEIEKGFNMSNSSLNYKSLTEHPIHFLNCLPTSPTAPLPPIVKEQEKGKEALRESQESHSENENWLFKAEIRRENALPPRAYSLKEHELFSIHIHPAFIVENTLLTPLTFRAIDLNDGRTLLLDTVEVGSVTHVHRIPKLNQLGISVLVPGFEWSKPIDILRLNPQQMTEIVLNGVNDSSARTAVQISQIDGKHGVPNLVFWSKYWVVNRTITKLLLTISGVFTPKKIYSIQPSENPVSFAPKGKRTQLNIQTENSFWSGSIDLGAQNMIGYVEVIEKMEPPEKRQVFEIGIDISPAPEQFWRTKVITFTPRYVVKNEWTCKIYLRQKGGKREVEIDPQQTGSFNWPSVICEKQLQMRMEGSNHWSGFFTLEDLGDLVLGIKDSYDQFNYFQISTTIKGSSLLIDISKRDRPEYLLKNNSPLNLYVSQLSSPREPKTSEGVPPRPSKQPFPVSVLSSQVVAPFSEIPFCWKDPSSVRRLRIKYGGRNSPISKEYVLDTLREYPPVDVPSTSLFINAQQIPTERKSLVGDQKDQETASLLGASKSEGDMTQALIPPSPSSSSVPKPPRSIRVRTFMETQEGDVKVLKVESVSEQELIELESEEAVDKPTTTPTASTTAETRRPVRHPRLRFKLNLMDIGISFVDKTPQEVFYLVLQNLNLTTVVSRKIMSLEASISRVEMDNQLDSPYSVVLRSLPSSTSTSSSETLINRFVPAFQLGLLTSRALNKKDFLAFNYFAVQLQQVDVAIDEVFLVKMMDIQKRFKAEVHKRRSRRLSDSSSSSSSSSSDLRSREQLAKVLKFRMELEGLGKAGGDSSRLKLYFEMLHLNPIQLNVSFMSVPEASEGSETEANAFERWLSVIGVLTDVENAPIQLNGLILENPLVSLSELKSNVGQHYKDQLLRQVYKMVGNANFLGSPATFFGHLGTGFYDFFHEPAHSIVHHPEDILSSIRKGTTSLVSSTIFSFADSAHRFGQTITKAATRISHDPSWRKERAERMKTKPETAIAGTLEGIKDLGKGFLHGLKGIWQDPQREVSKDKSIAGLAKGASKGLAGAVLKPAIGFGDFMTRTAEGVKHSTAPGLLDNPLSGRLRPPRPISEDGVILPLPTNELPLEALWAASSTGEGDSFGPYSSYSYSFSPNPSSTASYAASSTSSYSFDPYLLPLESSGSSTLHRSHSSPSIPGPPPPPPPPPSVQHLLEISSPIITVTPPDAEGTTGGGGAAPVTVEKKVEGTSAYAGTESPILPHKSLPSR